MYAWAKATKPQQHSQCCFTSHVMTMQALTCVMMQYKFGGLNDREPIPVFIDWHYVFMHMCNLKQCMQRQNPPTAVHLSQLSPDKQFFLSYTGIIRI